MQTVATFGVQIKHGQCTDEAITAEFQGKPGAKHCKEDLTPSTLSADPGI